MVLDRDTLFSNCNIEKNIAIIMTQTTYTRDETIEKLLLHNGDYMNVIRDYLGIKREKKSNKVKSVNQEVFKQIRGMLDEASKEYREQNPINLDQVIDNFNEADERKKTSA